MQNRVEAMQKEALSAVQFQEAGHFRPTLVVGLGGSGVETARRLKRILHERYKVNSLISFLFVDTDDAVYSSDPELAPVQQNECASIAVRNPERLIDEMKRGANLHPYFEQFLGEGIDVVLLRDATGAAGIRPVGRFAFHASFSNIFAHSITPAMQRIMEVRTLASAMMLGAEQNIEVVHSQPRIYIVCSVCGGTGSGIFMDTAVVLRYLMEQYHLDGEIVGIFYLPSVFSHEHGISPSLMEVIEANAYASLMEIEFLCNPDNLERADLRFLYPMIGEVRLKEPLFDEVFLVEGTNSNGAGLTSKRDAFEMVARSLMLDIGSPLGARARSAKRNSRAVIETIPCPETQAPRMMNSLAVTNLAVPIEELLRYCASRAVEEAWFYRDNRDGSVQIDQEVEQFLTAHSLDEREQKDQLSHHLLLGQDGRLSYEVPDRETLLSQAEGAGKRNWNSKLAYVAQRLEELFDHFHREWLPKQQRAIEEKAADHLSQAVHLAGYKAQGILQRSDYEQAAQFFRQLVEALTQVQGALHKKMEEKQALSRRAEEDFRAACRQMRDIKIGWIDRLSSNPSQLSVVDQAIEHLRTFMEASLYCVAARASLQAFEHVGEKNRSVTSQLSDWEQLVRNWKTHHDKAVKLLRRWREEVEERRYNQGYTLEWLAMLRRDFEQFYQQLSIPHDQIRRKIEQLRQGEKHEPAFGDLTTTRLDAEQDAALCLKAAAEVLSPLLREEANILKVVLDNREANTTRAEYLRRKIRLMLDVCQPFWSTTSPPGDARFESLVAVSVPPARNGKDTDDLIQAVRELCEAYGYRPELVPDGYPFAITVMRRTYGARAYYLSSAKRMQHFYLKRQRNEHVRARLHVDKRFSQILPLLHPPENRLHVEELWSWAVAYGYIAQQGEKYYIGIYRTSKNELIPKYRTEWQIALTEGLPEEWTGQLQHKILNTDEIGSDRLTAFRNFQYQTDYQEQVEEARRHVERRFTPEQLIGHLEEYVRRLTAQIDQTDEEELREHLDRVEREAINRYIRRLRRVG